MLLRAKYLAAQGADIFCPPQLKYFLYNHVDAEFFHTHPEALKMYEMLDDNDIWSSVKVWMQHEDKILSTLATDLINRNIFKVEVLDEPISEEELTAIQQKIAEQAGVTYEEAKYLINYSTIQKDMYDINDDKITILYKDGTCKDIAEASDLLNVALLSKKIRKYYLCYQRF